MTDLGSLPFGHAVWPQGINNSGQITGLALACGGGTHAFLYSNGSMTDLGTLPGTFFSYGWAINDFGQVTGTSYYTASGDSHAFLYSGGAMKDLNALIPSGSGWVLNSAVAINRYGQIAGYGQLNGAGRIFLLTPTSDT